MSFDVKLTDNFFEVLDAFKELDTNAILSAARRALNRTIVTVRKESFVEIKRHVKVKSGELRKDYTWLEKAKGGGVDSVEAAVHFSRAPLPLLLFVKGSKTPIQQKGIRVKARRRLTVEIQPGKKLKIQSGFIQRVKSLQVFKRKSSGGLAKQGTPSVAHIVLTKGIGPRLAQLAQERLNVNVLKELDYQLGKARARIRG